MVLRAGGRVWFRPVENAIDRHHAADPASFPRTSRDGFLLAPREQLEVLAAAARGELEVLAVVHSHCDAGPQLSAADEAGALVSPGEEVLPGVEHVVLSVLGAGTPRVEEVHAYRLEGGSFTGRTLPRPG